MLVHAVEASHVSEPISGFGLYDFGLRALNHQSWKHPHMLGCGGYGFETEFVDCSDTFHF